jgi:hypothetical protein
MGGFPTDRKTLSDVPSAVASAFIVAGLVLSSQLPVFTRLMSVCTAASVSAGVKAQCPAHLLLLVPHCQAHIAWLCCRQV